MVLIDILHYSCGIFLILYKPWALGMCVCILEINLSTPASQHVVVDVQLESELPEQKSCSI